MKESSEVETDFCRLMFLSLQSLGDWGTPDDSRFSLERNFLFWVCFTLSLVLLLSLWALPPPAFFRPDGRDVRWLTYFNNPPVHLWGCLTTIYWDSGWSWNCWTHLYSPFFLVFRLNCSFWRVSFCAKFLFYFQQHDFSLSYHYKLRGNGGQNGLFSEKQITQPPNRPTGIKRPTDHHT